MFASDFTKEEALSVLVNSAKALQRAPSHRLAYATNIVDKIWLFEATEDKDSLNLSSTVRQILDRSGDDIKGTRFPCWDYIDATVHGFRLGQIIGLVAGSGVGKTAMALNMFLGFVQNNPEYDHFFVPLEQPANEIADRWKTMCGDNERLYDKVHIISNYGDRGEFRHLSLDEIRQYLLQFKERTGKKIGCVVIDHIGALKKKSKDGENQGLIEICHEMKAFAVETNTMLVMQSQAPRDKAGIGDIELNKDAAYGTLFFESYCDYLIAIWQPLKRCYSEEGCPTVTAFKFGKIRHKKAGIDKISEDVCYRLFFDPKTEHLRELTQIEEKSFDFFNNKALNLRKADRKTDLVPYKSITWTKGEVNGKVNNNQNVTGTQRT
jgi:KaiC/GvpD/RAD55 family RecA-like ATPase